MDTEQMIRALRYEAEKHEDDKLFTGDTNISAMCTDAANKIEELNNKLNTKDTPTAPNISSVFISAYCNTCDYRSNVMLTNPICMSCKRCKVIDKRDNYKERS